MMFSPSRELPKQKLLDDLERQPSYQHAFSWLTLWAAFAFATLIGFSRLSYGLLLPVLRAGLGGSYSVLGTVATINFIGYLLGTFVLPVLLTRMQNRVRLNLLGLFATNLIMVLSALSVSLWQLAVYRLLIGFFSAIAVVLTMALTLERIYPHERGRASGIVWMGAGAGLAISGLIAPPLIGSGTEVGWRLVWAIMGLVGIVAAIGLSSCMRSQAPLLRQNKRVSTSVGTSHPQKTFWAALRPLVLPHRLLWLMLVYFWFGAGYITYFTFFISLLEQQGVPALYAGFVWAAIGIAAAVSAWIWGRILDRWPTGFTVAVSLVFGVCGSLAVLTNTVALEYAGAGLVALTSLLGAPLMTTVLLKWAVPDEEYAASYSAFTALFAVGQIFGPLLGGIVIEKVNLQAGIATSALLLGAATLSACAYGLVQRSRRKPLSCEMGRDGDAG